MDIRPLLFLIFIFLFLLILGIKMFVVPGEDELLVVFRLGRLLRVCPPGLNIVFPFLDRVVPIKFDKIPDWQKLSDEQLREKAAQLAGYSID